MPHPPRTAVLLLLVLAGCSGRRARPAPRLVPAAPLASGVTAFERVNVVRRDRDVVLRDQTVIVRDGRIEQVGPASAAGVPAGAARIAGRGRYLMPALTDMDVQLSPTSWRLRRELAL